MKLFIAALVPVVLAIGCTTPAPKSMAGFPLTPGENRSPAAQGWTDRPMAVSCKIGETTQVHTLYHCGHKNAQTMSYPMVDGKADYSKGRMIDHPNGGVGEYWCEGTISEVFSVRKTGWAGTGGSVYQITYLPGKFTGVSPIEIDGQTVSCENLEIRN